MVHPNARLSPEGRWRLVRLVVEDGWSVARAAERFQVSDRLVGGEPGAQRHGGRVNLNWIWPTFCDQTGPRPVAEQVTMPGM